MCKLIDVSGAPISVTIQNKSVIPIVGVRLELVCEAIGGNPRPSISWWKDEEEMEGAEIRACIVIIIFLIRLAEFCRYLKMARALSAISGTSPQCLKKEI